MLDFDAYLRRIGLDSADKPTWQVVHRAHVTTIPFENLDSHRGIPISLEQADLERKLVASWRGGYCFEHNLLLASALEHMGLEVEPMLARVRAGGAPRQTRPTTHLVLRATDGDGRQWHADVGFGLGTLLDPIPFGPAGVCEQSGQVRYLGASSMYAWQFAKLQHAAALGGWTRFVSMQNQYNLLRRQDEPELMAMCADTGVGLVPYSPQGKGRLARPWGEQSTRSSVDHVVQAFDSPLDQPVVHAVQELAAARGVTMAQVALAWVLRHPAVSAPIVGATKPHHLPEAVAALELKLTDDEAAALEKPYSNHGPSWY